MNYGVGCAVDAGVVAGVPDVPVAVVPVVVGAGVAFACGFRFALASAAAFCAAALAGSGAAGAVVPEVFINSRRTAELGAPRCA